MILHTHIKSGGPLTVAMLLKVRLDHSQPAQIFIKSLPTPEELVEFPSRNYASADNDSKN